MKRPYYLLILTCLSLLSSLKAAPPFPGGGGNYGGTIPATSLGDPNDSGILTVILQDTGAASLKLVWQGQTYVFKQPFEGDSSSGMLARDIPKKNPKTAGTKLSLFCALDPDTRKITGVVTDSEATSNGTFELSGQLPDPAVTAQLDPGLRTAFFDGDSSIPGDGFAVVTVSKTKSRSSRVVGGLPDNEKYSTGSPLRGANYALRGGLYAQKNLGSGGQVLGDATASSTDTFARSEEGNTPRGGGLASLLAALRWHKNAGVVGTRSYPGAFKKDFNLDTIPYARNRDARYILTGGHEPLLSNARIKITSGNLSAPNDPVTADLSVTFLGGRVVGPNPHKIHLNMIPFVARFTGNFRHPDTGEKIKFNGGFRSFFGVTPGEGRGNFLSRPDRNDPAQSASGSVRIVIEN